MNPLFSTAIGVVFTVVGAIAVIIMLELKGSARDRKHGTSLIRLHRILGWLFVLVFALMLAGMIYRVSDYQNEFSPRIILHLFLALLLVPLLAVKILVARRHKALTARLFSLGVTIFALGFVLSALTGGYYFLHSEDVKYVSLTGAESAVMDENFGRILVTRKCAKCHTLERVFNSFKDEEGWTRTVNRMAVIDAPNIREYDVKQIIFFLLRHQERRRGEQAGLVREEIGKTLVRTKCTRCHDLERVYRAQKTEEDWRITVEKMIQLAVDADFLTGQEKDTIITYLTRR